MINPCESDELRAWLEWLNGLGWRIAHGPAIRPEERNAERADFGQNVLERLQRDALLPKLVGGKLKVTQLRPNCYD